MLTPGRKFSAGTGYRYGFNGKELDIEDPIQYDYGFRILDPRLGRFKSLDPLQKKFPELSPYQFASNSPIANVDLDGKEAKYYTTTITESYNTKGKLAQVTISTVYEKSKEAGFYANGITDWGYRKEGSKGSGELFTIIKVKKYEADDNGVRRQEITNVGDVYHSSPEDNKKHGGYGGFAFYSENGQSEETRVGSFDDLTMVEMSGLLTKAKFASEVGIWENTTEGIDIIEEKIKEMQEERKKAGETKPTSPSSSSVNTKQGTTDAVTNSAKQTTYPPKHVTITKIVKPRVSYSYGTEMIWYKNHDTTIIYKSLKPKETKKTSN